MSISSIEQRLKRVENQVERLQEQELVEFITCWGDEPIEEDGCIVYVTEWGGGRLEDEEIIPDEDEEEDE